MGMKIHSVRGEAEVRRGREGAGRPVGGGEGKGSRAGGRGGRTGWRLGGIL